jgi:hypothetical protein
MMRIPTLEEDGRKEGRCCVGADKKEDVSLSKKDIFVA